MNHQNIHGHEIIDIVSLHPEGLSSGRLAAIATERFGVDARFLTCSTENMTLPELLEFLHERSKVELRGQTVFPGGSPACEHD